MRRLNLLKFIVSLILTTLFFTSHLFGQRPQKGSSQTSVIGWADESHYLIKSVEADKSPVIKSVDIISGKGVIVPPVKSERELLSDALPPGSVINPSDVLSPDANGVVLIRENDLFYFSACDGKILRLTND